MAEEGLGTVGTSVTWGLPHGSRRAALPHRAPALGHGVRPLFGPRMLGLRSRKPAFRYPVLEESQAVDKDLKKQARFAEASLVTTVKKKASNAPTTTME